MPLAAPSTRPVALPAASTASDTRIADRGVALDAAVELHGRRVAKGEEARIGRPAVDVDPVVGRDLGSGRSERERAQERVREQIGHLSRRWPLLDEDVALREARIVLRPGDDGRARARNREDVAERRPEL